MMSGALYLLPNRIAQGPVDAALPADVLKRLAEIDLFFVEAAKSARAALKAFGHPKPVAELTIEEIGHDPNPEKIDAWLAPVVRGRSAAILSESGCPGIADPGAQIVARAHELGIRVVPWVGPSSILLALMASGLDGQRFRFVGYLPKHEAERREAMLAMERASRASETQIFIETPYRNQAVFDHLIETLSPTTRITAAVDIGGPEESIRTKRADDWRKAPESERTLPKSPAVFLFLAEPARGEAPRYAPKHAARKGGLRRASPHKGRRS